MILERRHGRRHGERYAGMGDLCVARYSPRMRFIPCRIQGGVKHFPLRLLESMLRRALRFRLQLEALTILVISFATVSNRAHLSPVMFAAASYAWRYILPIGYPILGF